MTKKTGHETAYILVPILYGLLAVAVAMLVCWSGQYPFGSDTMTHIYRGDMVYNAIKDGNIFPLYDPMWYNGVEVLGWCAPIPLYFTAFCQAAAGGSPIDGYLIFVGLIFFAGAISWMFIGIRKNRMLMCSFIGILWFFMPHNLYVLFFEGNLARALCVVILPLFISYIYDYISEGRLGSLVKLMIMYALMVLCDFEYVVMVTISIFIFSVVYGIICRKWKRQLEAFVGMAASFMVTGIWSVSHIMLGSGSGNAETMYRYFQSILKSLNPVERYTGLNRFYYFGLAVFLLAVFGILFSKKKSMPGFWTAIIILVGTTSSAYAVLSVIPGDSSLIMCQYISIALCPALYSFVMWNSLKKYMQLIICVLLVLDAVPSLNLVYGNLSGVPVEERFDEQNETTLIMKAKEISQQRIAMFDGSELESMGNYLVTNYENGKAASFGSDWASAVTRTNLAQLNRALSGGFYDYFFDRCLDLGNDTVLIKLSQMDTLASSISKLDVAAENAGYELAGSNEFYRLYHIDMAGNWGTITKYPAVGIGTGASVISLAFPAVQEMSSPNLTDYTFEELSQYKLIYLSGFTYNDRESAEDLIVKLSEAGVRIVILADGIPESRASHAKEFLGIICNNVKFSNGYPFLDTKVGVLDCGFFPQGKEEWDTVYVSGLDKVWGTVREDGMNLDFYGTVKNENIIVVGLNLTYYYALTEDKEIGRLLEDITDMETGKTPDRQLVPITVSYGNNSITITSPKDGVDTSLAYHKMFRSSQDISEENNLLYVNAGTTEIKMKYRYFYPGLIVTILGLCLAAALIYVHIYWQKNMLIKNAGEGEHKNSEENMREAVGEGECEGSVEAVKDNIE